MPVLTEYDDLKGTIFQDIVDRSAGKNPQSAFEDNLRDVVNLTKTPFLDLGGRSKFEKDIFADPYHLNEKGAKKLALLISRAILDILGNDL